MCNVRQPFILQIERSDGFNDGLSTESRNTKLRLILAWERVNKMQFNNYCLT